MTQLELNDHEQQTLTEALQSFLAELRNEVTHTDRHTFRMQLREQEQTLKGVLSKLTH